MARQFFPILVLVLASAYYFASKDHYDPKTIAGKRVLVTGASSGIGEALAYHYSELGARLVLTARRGDLLEQVAKNCRQLGAKEVSVVPADMGNPKDRLKVVAHTKKQLAGLDHLILNHALIRGGWWHSNPENLTTLENDMNVNFFSHVDLSSRFLPMLIESKGRIGSVSSVAGKFSSPLTTTYCSSKFAMQGFFSAWRQELNYGQSGVSVTLAVLGPIHTDSGVNLIRSFNSSYDFASIASSPQDTARAIVRAVETRVYELYYGWLAGVMVNIHKLIPDTFENYAGYRVLKNFKK